MDGFKAVIVLCIAVAVIAFALAGKKDKDD